MTLRMEPTWKAALAKEFHKEYFKTLTEKVRQKYLAGGVFPPPKHVFNAFMHCPFDDVKVVILGQDPYHGPGQAMGLAFSVLDGVRTPPSLQNIYKEIRTDIGTDIPQSGNLERWAKQGVLLLNSTLTVEAKQAASHQGLGWEQFTDAVIQNISSQKQHVVFLLWGNYARSKKALIDTHKHCVLEAPHPSPLSAHRGFLGCQHFSKANQYLQQHGSKAITW